MVFMMLSWSWTLFCSFFPQHGRGAILLAAVCPGNEIINTFTAGSSAGSVQQCWLALAKSQSNLGCCMPIGAAVAGNSLNLPAGKSCAPSGVPVKTLTVWATSPFCTVLGSAGTEVHSARLSIACFVGFECLGYL